MKLIRTFSTLITGALLAASAAYAKAPAPQPAASVQSYILLDRTGSMSPIWDEALASVNAFAESFGKDAPGETVDPNLRTKVTLAVFDAQGGLQFDVLRDKVAPENWTPVTNAEATPRGMTPLFDAIGRTIALAEADNPEKAVIVIMTDGHENASREVTREGAKAAIDRAQARGWEVVFLGAEFARFNDADAIGMAPSQTMAIGQGRMEQSMDSLAQRARSYGKGEAAAIVFDEADRALAGEEEVKARQGQR
ncbi:VWA domain-containing protein [Hyphomonas sp.]|uniref:VWA domain-containing protein n=1 Tax=Hyphomonas sp. TaxID=87 RepID=UPI00391D6A2E